MRWTTVTSRRRAPAAITCAAPPHLVRFASHVGHERPRPSKGALALEFEALAEPRVVHDLPAGRFQLVQLCSRSDSSCRRSRTLCRRSSWLRRGESHRRRRHERCEARGTQGGAKRSAQQAAVHSDADAAPGRAIRKSAIKVKLAKGSQRRSSRLLMVTRDSVRYSTAQSIEQRRKCEIDIFRTAGAAGVVSQQTPRCASQCHQPGPTWRARRLTPLCER